MSSPEPSLPATPLDEAAADGNNHSALDPQEAAQLADDDRDSPTPPAADPTRDMDHDLSDNDSVLSDIDEAQFEDFDPANLDIQERPTIAVDEDNVNLIGRHKRKRDADGEYVDGGSGGGGGGGADDAGSRRKKKEGRRDKPKKSRRKKEGRGADGGGVAGGEDEDGAALSGGPEGREGDGKRRRRTREDGERRERQRARRPSPENEEELDPETRRRRALDKAMDAALKNPNRSRRRKMDGIDVATMADEEIASLRTRMAEAAERDVQARSTNPPQPAMHKLRLLPEVTALLNRNGRDIENAIVDPENNLLESVRFFLEPLNDGSLPAYNIQRDLFNALVRLPVGKDALISSGIGKVVLFYTKSKKPEPRIKRQAERLLAEWTRPILKRSDNYRARVLETADYDPTRAPRPVDAATAAAAGGVGAGGSQSSSSQARSLAIESAEERRKRELAPPEKPGRVSLSTAAPKSYSIVPRSNVVAGRYARPVGAGSDEAMRRLKMRQLQAQGKGPRRG